MAVITSWQLRFTAVKGGLKSATAGTDAYRALATLALVAAGGLKVCLKLNSFRSRIRSVPGAP